MENLIENLEETTRGSIARKPHLPEVNLPHGDYHLLVIGINNYENKYSYTNLPNAERDAADLAEELEKRYKFKQIKKLSNKEATREAILKSLESFESVKTRDNVIIFFAGHGYRQQPLGYIIPYDAEARTKSGFIPYSTIVEHFHLIPAKHILLIVDCCYGGTLINQRSSETTSVDVQGLENSASRKFISSGHDDERVPDGLVGGNSPFMQLLLNTLKTNEEQKLPIHALYGQIIKRIEADKLQIPTPRCAPLVHVGDKNGDMVLRLANSENEELKAYEKAMSLRTKTVLEFFIKEFKESTHIPEIEAVYQAEYDQQELEWEAARKLKTIESLKNFLNKYPDEFFSPAAKRELLRLERSKPLYKKALAIRDVANKKLLENEYVRNKDIDELIATQYQEAIYCLTQAIVIYPNFIDAYYVRADLNRFFGNHQKVMDDFNEILKIEFDIFAYSERTFAKLRMGLDEEALEDFNTIINSEPNNADLYANRGIVKEKMGDFEGAFEDYTRASILNPNDIFNKQMVEDIKTKLKNI